MNKELLERRSGARRLLLFPVEPPVHIGTRPSLGDAAAGRLRRRLERRLCRATVVLLRAEVADALCVVSRESAGKSQIESTLTR